MFRIVGAWEASVKMVKERQLQGRPADHPTGTLVAPSGEAADVEERHGGEYEVRP